MRFGGEGEVAIEALEPGLDSGEHEIATEVEQQVLAGVAKANEELGTHYQVTQIQYHANTSSEDFAQLAYYLTTQMHEMRREPS